MKRLTAFAALLATLIVLTARADHLVVSRHALVKAIAVSDAPTLIVVEEGDMLQLASTQQTNGYYQVSLPDGRLGWIYRNMARRFPGNLPPLVGPLPPSPSTPPPTPPGGGDDDVVDAGSGAPTAFDEDQDIIFGVPEFADQLQILDNVGYTVGYSEVTHGPIWVSYHLFAVGNKKSPEREDLFGADTRVADPVPASGYQSTGYDRGHMAPSAPIGRRYGKAAQDKTFLMTNMVPQVPGLNQRGWEALESVISSDYAEDFGEVWVVVGPIFEGPCRELESGPRVPSHTFMVIVDIDESDNSVRALGVVMPQERINAERLSKYVKTINEIEMRTGLNLLNELSDDVEDAVEASSPDADWNISQVLQPRFAGTARTKKTQVCQ